MKGGDIRVISANVTQEILTAILLTLSRCAVFISCFLW